MPHKDREAARAYSKVWAAEHPEQYRAYQKAYRTSRLENTRAYRAAHREERYAYFVAWHKNHPGKNMEYKHRRRARKKGNGGSYTLEEWSTLAKAYGGCAACRLSEPEIMALGRKLVPDHVIPLAKGGTNDIGNLQPLCHGKGGCNNKKSAKHIDYRRAS